MKNTIQNNKNKDEDRAARFRRVASKRTDLVLHYLHLLGNCSNKSTYRYADEEALKIFKAIEEQLRITKIRFKSGKTKRKFRL